MDSNFFDRQPSGSGQARSFSAVRENQMQLKIDELFTFLCYKGKHILNSLIN